MLHVPMAFSEGCRFVRETVRFFSALLACAAGDVKWRCVRGRYSVERIRRETLCQVRMPITGLVRVAGYNTCGF